VVLTQEGEESLLELAERESNITVKNSPKCAAPGARRKPLQDDLDLPRRELVTNLGFMAHPRETLLREDASEVHQSSRR
jgi:hypothetical protein